MANKNLDLMKTSDLVDLFLKEEEKNIESIKKEKRKIAKIIQQIKKKIDCGGRVIYIGAGTSGRIGLLDAVECKPTFNTNIFTGIIAGGDNAFIKAKEGAEDDQLTAIDDLKKIRLNSQDVVIGIAASGETPYTTAAILYAKKKKALTIGISSSPKSTLSKITEYEISTYAGKEIIDGSSRLKSGTAQKIILNMISSIAMIKSGKVYNNLMVDVQPTNKKLVKRAIEIISTICHISFTEAKKAFHSAGKNVKIAIVMSKLNCTKSKAQSLLKNNNGDLRKVI